MADGQKRSWIQVRVIGPDGEQLGQDIDLDVDDLVLLSDEDERALERLGYRAYEQILADAPDRLRELIAADADEEAEDAYGNEHLE
jgi:hypothetical protein